MEAIGRKRDVNAGTFATRGTGSMASVERHFLTLLLRCTLFLTRHPCYRTVTATGSPSDRAAGRPRTGP